MRQEEGGAEQRAGPRDPGLHQERREQHRGQRVEHDVDDVVAHELWAERLDLDRVCQRVHR